MNTEQIQTSAAGSPGAEAPRFSQQKLLAVSSDIDQQPRWRDGANKACAYYDGDQLEPEVVAVLEERGQPKTIHNLIAPTIDGVLGMEAKTRTDLMVVSDDPDEEAEKLADAINAEFADACRLSNLNKARSDAYAEQIKAGLSWVEVRRNSDPFGSKFKVSTVNRNEVFWDWLSREADLSDCRWLMRRRWMDIDEAKVSFPEMSQIIDYSVHEWRGFIDTTLAEGQDSQLMSAWEEYQSWSREQSEWLQSDRKRILLQVVYYRVYQRMPVIELNNGRVVAFDKNNLIQAVAVAIGRVQVTIGRVSRIREAWFVGPHFITDRPCTAPQGMFPLVPFWGYRKDKTGEPYGLVSRAIPAQDEVNFRRMKLTWLLQAKRVIKDDVLKTRDSNNATIKDIWRKVDASYGEELPQVQAGEFLAHIAEKHTPGKLGAAWNRVVSLVKAVLRRTGLLQPSDLNDIGYIRDTIRTLGQRVREGYVPRDGGEVSYSRTGKPDPFKADSYDARQFAEEVRHVATLDKDPRRDIRMGDTPAVLRALGAPNRELIMPGHVVHKATRPEIKDHHVSVETMAELPHLLADPVAVVTSRTEPDALITLIKAKDKKGAPVVVAVHMHAKGVFVEVNKIASVYGKDNRQALQEQLDNDLLYINKEKAADWLHSARLQLPAENTINGSSGIKVLQPDDIRKGPYYSRSRSALSPEETLAARFVRQMQDKFQVLKAVQDKIRESGGKLDDSNDAYLAEELFHGKAENDLNVMKERYVKPLAKLLADYDIPQSALDEYLYARHAPERNAHIAKINPKMPDGGSGMTNAEAADIMDRVRRSGKQAQYDRLAGIVDDMLARRRELIKTAGLEKEGVVDAWQNAYKHYVPLKGQDADGTVPRTGRGYVISGKESKMAMGRNSRAQSPSTQAIQDLTESLIRNRKNEVGNAFLKLVQDNPDKDYWQVFTDDKPDTTRRVVEKNDPETGETIRQVEEMPVPMAMMSDRYFTTKKDGKTYYIKLHDERLMRAMKNMGPETGNVVIQTLARVNRFMSAMNTSLNPEFLVSNFVRDMQTAVMNLKAEQGRDDGKLNGRDIAMKTVRDSGIAMKAIYASLRGKSLTGKGADWQKTWKEFVEDGAKTGWFRMDDLNGQMKEMDHLVSLAKGGWKGQGIQSWHSFTKLVENANNAVENALRLSAYKHARDAGISRAQAASLAKNMTVNFNRRGEQGVLLNSLYMFANASIQGTANMMRSLAHLNGDGPLLQRLRWSNLNMAQKMALTAVGAGYLLGSLNRAGAGQDEDGVNWYDKVPDYVKEHNLVIMKSLFGGKAGEYWSIPLPYGYNMFYLLGSTAEGVTRGNLTASKAAGNIVGGMLGAFNPLGSEDSKTLTGTLFKNAAPTILRPVADLWANESFMGTPIYQENFPTGTPKPESTLGRRSTPEAYKAFANWLNTLTGGSQYRSGALDINPDKMKYWIDYVSGGMGRFAGKTIDAAAKTYNGIDIPPQQIPFLGKISGKVMPYADRQAMYDHIDELRQYNAELKSLSGADRAAFRNKYSGQLSMNGIIHQSEIQLKNLRKQRDEVYSDPTLTARQQADRVLMIEQNMKKVVDSFNQEYREMTGE